jgi:hypothetical protein
VKNMRLLVVLVVATAGLVVPTADAEPKAGLFAEASTAVDGAMVRRVRDTGEGVVCYVVTSNLDGYAHAQIPAVSCVLISGRNAR